MQEVSSTVVGIPLLAPCLKAFPVLTLGAVMMELLAIYIQERERARASERARERERERGAPG